MPGFLAHRARRTVPFTLVENSQRGELESVSPRGSLKPAGDSGLVSYEDVTMLYTGIRACKARCKSL